MRSNHSTRSKHLFGCSLTSVNPTMKSLRSFGHTVNFTGSSMLNGTQLLRRPPMTSNEHREWRPIPGTTRREYCLVSGSVRVVREKLLFLPPGKQFSYEVQEQAPSGEWVLAHDMMMSAYTAFTKA